jgi:hypothetical protein
MAGATGVRRNLAEADGSLYINRWLTGQYTNRSPLYVPVSALGIQVISSRDVLWDGLNVELTPQMTLARRCGFSRFCSTAFGSSDWPLAFSSFKNLSGTIKLLVDTPTKVAPSPTITMSINSFKVSISASGQTRQSKCPPVLSTI